MAHDGRILAVLGPTNTGKTHYAIERMLAHRSGVIGLPLRLLAREVYDRIVAARGPSVVALVTGEERIVPTRAQYWVCTVEAMPEGMGCDFLAVDEIQLCADPERGHVFTDRLLNARGRLETIFMGAETMRGAIAALVPGVQFSRRERFSTLTYTGARKLSRMPERSAIVGFSVDNCYAIAELLRRTKGGAAVVMGALSPRTRNAQVAMYQRGEVDYLVATDAIGMGLNLDIEHVAFSAVEKFDGRRWRHLDAGELAQIAGRAGRHMKAGSFGTTGEAPALEDEVIQAIENHAFRPVQKLQWRNARLRFGSIRALIASLEERTDNPWLTRVRDADDVTALKTLAEDAEVQARASDGHSVHLLWDVCRVPDFRGISKGEHAALLRRIFCDLHQHGHVERAWFAAQVERIDRTDGDIDTLSKRLAYIRTWTYVAQRKHWVQDEEHWRAETRRVEDRLSDALHAALTQAFVDRRTSVLARRLKQRESLVAEVTDKGEVSVDGELLGRLEGFRFRADKTASPDEARTVARAAREALAPQFTLRADRFYNAPDTEIDVTEQGGLMWGSDAVGKLVAGADPLKPEAKAFVDEEAGEEVAKKVQRRLQHFVDRRVAATQEPLIALSRDETLTGQAKGFAYRMVENFGIIPRGEVADEVKSLGQEDRAALRKHGIRFGQFTIFMPALLKPAPTRIRLLLWGLSKGLDEFPESPPPGLVTVPAAQGVPAGYFAMAGYRAAGERAVRLDMLERLADMLRDRDSRGGFEANPDMLSITGLSLEQFAVLMEGLGYRAEKGERPKVKPAAAGPQPDQPGPDVPAPGPTPDAPQTPEETPQPDLPEAPPQTPDTPDVPVPDPTPTEPDLPGDPDPAPGPDVPAPDPSPTAPDIPSETPPEPPVEAPGDTPTEMPPPGGPSELPGQMPGAPTMEDGTEAIGGRSAPVTSEMRADELADAGADAGTEVRADVPNEFPEAAAPAETEIFYTFTWAGRGRQQRGAPRGERQGQGAAQGKGQRRGARQDQGHQGQGRERGAKGQGPRDGRDGPNRAKGPKGKRGGPKGDRAPQTYDSRPPRKEKQVDPDNPFAAALAGFKAK
ncbi:helicase-related protein [Wenxinia saemankumensis]|uniref:ATP-dependent RNA helicase SUPV3L1/SUV3 n=1 Tax=Wenxinia saemankumensis TaxID=1447782 RepID=A0A1M6CKD6_9RHOB|nr:helicase-related protein [Wenxinia saemankumensis]SHI61466.1 ATP-dependent RNA helicase SUPV3L1/SUV3 [Wenxinia saemankumensis]